MGGIGLGQAGIRRLGGAFCIVGGLGLIFALGALWNGMLYVQWWGNTYLLPSGVMTSLLTLSVTGLGIAMFAGGLPTVRGVRLGIGVMGSIFWGVFSALFLTAHFATFEYWFHLWFAWWPPHYLFAAPLVVGVYHPELATDLSVIIPFLIALWTVVRPAQSIVDRSFAAILFGFCVLVGMSAALGMYLEAQYWMDIEQNAGLMDPTKGPLLGVYFIYANLILLLGTNAYLLWTRRPPACPTGKPEAST